MWTGREVRGVRSVQSKGVNQGRLPGGGGLESGQVLIS